MRRFYHEIFLFFQSALKGPALLSTALFAVGLAVTYLLLKDNSQLLATAWEQVQRIFEAKNVNGIEDVTVLFLLKNNLIACAAMILCGLMPFLFLPGFSLFSNAAVIGVAAALSGSLGLSFAYLLSGLLPHGIFEVPALLLSAALGLYLCRELTASVLGHRKGIPFKKAFFAVLRFFSGVCLPLIVIAAFIEAVVTPLVMAAFY